MIEIPLPVGTFEEWVRSIMFTNDVLDIPPPTNDDWKDCALALVDSDLFTGTLLPNPQNYDDWREWAAQVKSVSASG